MQELQRFDLGSVFKISIIMYAILGYLITIPVALLMNALQSFMSPGMPMDQGVGIFQFGIMWAIIWPLLYSFFAGVLTTCAAALYNFLVKFTGGIKVDFVPQHTNSNQDTL